ncbi:MAG: phosphopantetheine-binding protein [Treponema sp.]|jgi:acyl carrier protein|nr:phosphopantetheine-binding protein [Treponema sp.]
MELQDFISKFAGQFDETALEEFRADTEFKELDEWSSMLILAVIGMINEVYGVTIKGADIRRAKTIEDLFAIVKSMQG